MGPQQQDPKSLQAWDCESQLGQRPCFESSSSCTKECKQHPGCWVCCLQKHPTYTSISFTLIIPEDSCQQTPLKVSFMKIYVFSQFLQSSHHKPWIELALTSWAQSSRSSGVIISIVWNLCILRYTWADDSLSTWNLRKGIPSDV
jgi:hypothetical protein